MTALGSVSGRVGSGGFQEGRGLAGTRLGLAGHVLSGKGEGKSLGLDRRAALEPGFGDPFHDGLGKSELREADLCQQSI